MNDLPWFAEWAHHHHARNARYGAPDPFNPESAADLGTTLRAFAEEAITFEAATRASEKLAVEAPTPRLHLKVLMKLAREAKAVIPAAAGVPATKEEAERLSRDCEDCGGSGQAIRFRHLGRGVVVLYCLCAMGRWTEAKHREAGKRHWHDLADHDSLQLGRVPWSNAPDNRFRWPPECWDGERDRPIKAPTWPAPRAEEVAAPAPARRPSPAPVDPGLYERARSAPDVYRLPGDPAPVPAIDPSDPPF